MDATAASRNDYRPDIDALRAFAVLAVIGYHWTIDESYGSFVVLLGPSMEYKQPLPRLLARYLTGADAPAVAYLNELIFPLDDRMSMELPDHNRFAYASVLRNVCSGRSCPVYAADAVPMIWDYSHLTVQGSAFVMARVLPLLRAP